MFERPPRWLRRPSPNPPALVLVLMLVGCGDDGTDPTDVALPDDAPAEAQTVTKKAEFLPPEEQARQDELRGWSACLRRTEPRIRDSWRRYTAAIDPETGRPARRSEIEPFVHRIAQDLGACRALPDPSQGVEAIPKATRDAVAAYLQAIETFAALTEQLAPYYDDKAYKDDGWALGEELAPKMSAAFAAFETSADQLRSSLRQARDEADEAALELLREADAPAVAGLAIAVGRDARALRACFEIETPDVASCKSALAALEASEGLVVQAVEHPPQTRYVFWLEALSRTTRRLLHRAESALDALNPPQGRRRPSDSTAHRDEVFAAARHVEDVADNVRYGL